MLFAERVISSPTDWLLRLLPLASKQSPVKLRIHWNQKKLSALKPAFLEALLQHFQLLRLTFKLKDQFAEDWVHTVHTNLIWLRQKSFPEAPVDKAPAKPNVLILSFRNVLRAWQHCVSIPILRFDANLILRVAAQLGQP